MASVTVGVFGNHAYAKELGKKATESDVTLYSYREGNDHVSLVAPTRHPEKIQPLSYAALSADAALVIVSALTKELGETLVALDAADIRQGAFVLQEYLQPEQVKTLVRGTVAEHYDFLADRAPDVRARIPSWAPKPRDGPVSVPVDHHFHVKGIGPVVLGFVKQGRLARHATLRVFPTAKSAQVRSIQVHDADVEAAATGDHVGVALKGIEDADLDRGHVLAPEGSLTVVPAGSAVKVEVEVTRYLHHAPRPGASLHLGLGWQFVPVKVAAGNIAASATTTIEVVPEKPFTVAPGEKGILFNVEEKAQRIVGRARVAG